MHNAMPLVFFLYAAILFGGGIMGYMVAKSTMSIIGSAAFAAVSIVAGLLTRSNPSAGLTVGIVNALAVAGFFFYRYQSTGKPMPAFPSIALSILVIVLAAIAFSSIRRASGG